MSALHYQSATAIAAAIRQGSLTARAALEHFLERVDSLNGAINAVVWQDREGARRRADAADAARAAGAPLGPLHGVPMTVKESYQVAGSPTTQGIPQFRDNVTPRDALAVQRVTAAGANIFGKTNVPIRLADFQSYNEIYGTTENPWKAGRTPGGSSGGSAAALAAGMTGLEMGSDIGGSIRNPAHYCGVFGHKPTWGLAPPRWHSLDESVAPTDISVIGPLARSADDLATTLGLMAGPDELEAPGLALDLPRLEGPLSGLRIGIWASAEPLLPTSAAVGARIQAVADALGRAGARVDDKARPAFDPEHSHHVFSALLTAAMAARLPDDVFQHRIASVEAAKADDQRASIVQGRWQTMRFRDWVKLNEARQKLRWAWRRFFDDVDFLITPVMPTTAFPHDHGPEGGRQIAIDGQQLPYFNQTFWAGLAGVVYLPATVFPAGVADDGLPVGLQIIGPAYADMRTIGLAQRLEAMGFAFTPPPGL
ncbi:MAG TPA: amidase [Caulobacteraceae bacterium]|nr:amidase [Caulobacteraceae bacterium]